MHEYHVDMAEARYNASWRRYWPVWAAGAAAGWACIYAILGVIWTVGGSGFPFGLAADPAGNWSALAGVRAATGAPAIAALGLVGMIVALLMTRAPRRGLFSTARMAFAWSAAVLLALVIPDYRVIAALAYAPVLLVGALVGWTPVNFGAALAWPVLNQGLCIGGGLIWGAAALGYWRRMRGACPACGRAVTESRWTTPAAVARWGRWAVAIAVVIPLLYAATRWAWALGIPLGINESFFTQIQMTWLRLMGAGLATVAAGGAILTLGLVQPWGEIFPRWMLGLAGRRVPPALAMVPATIMAVIITGAGLMFIRVVLQDGFPEAGWATLAPELLWPLWGVALGAATLAYGYRRRGQCSVCGHGTPTIPADQPAPRIGAVVGGVT